MDNQTVGAPIQLPVIDISNPNDPAVGKEMLDAATKYGFFYVNSKGSDFAVADVKKAFGLVWQWPGLQTYATHATTV